MQNDCERRCILDMMALNSSEKPSCYVTLIFRSVSRQFNIFHMLITFSISALITICYKALIRISMTLFISFSNNQCAHVE